MARRVQHQCAYILHSRPYSESSLLIDAFSRDFGRVSLLAKGARRIKSKVRGLLRPFQPLLLSWSGKGELQTLTGAESECVIRKLDQESWLCGCYMNELLIKLLHKHDPHETLFEQYDQSLSALEQTNSIQMILRIFEKRLLTEIGYGLVLTHDVKNNQPVMQEHTYHYHPQSGPVISQGNQSNSVFKVSGSTLLALEKEDFSDSRQINQSKLLMRALLNQSMLGRDLKCRLVLRHINAIN